MPVPGISELIATTLSNRSTTVQDNVTRNNALLTYLKRRGKIRTVSGGRSIVETISFAENPNFGWYSGYDQLPLSPADVISGAEYPYKQAACPVVISGLEQLQNSGREALFDLLEERIANAEATMANGVSAGLFSDGTGSGGKVITGLDAAVPQDPTTGTYGGINRATWPFWRSQLQDPAATPTAATIQTEMTALWTKLVRGGDRPDLILAGATIWATFMGSVATAVRFVDTGTPNVGFPSLKFMDADVILDGGIGGGNGVPTDMYFLNTKYLSFRPHRDRNMVPLSPTRRWSINQDAEAQILAWAGNLTCSGAQFQGRLKGD